MFTWICPTCGRECPPSYTECPDCSAKQKGAPAAPPSVAAPPPPVARPVTTSPPAPPPPENPAPPPLAPEAVTGPADLYRPPPRPNLPPWAVTAGVALLLMLLGAGLYYFIAAQREGGAATAAPAFETPTAPAGSSHPYAKHLEIAGLRITEDSRRRPQIRYLIINHSAAELAPVPMRVTFTTSNAHPDAAPVATVEIKTPRIGPYESEEMTSPINTNLRAYELPDWQFLRAHFEVLE